MRDHLQLREGTPHAIAIDHGHSQARGAIYGHDRVEPAGFDAHGGFDRRPDVFAHAQEGVDDVIAIGHLLDHDGRRAHHGSRHDEIVVIEFVEGVELDGPVIADGLPRHELADVGVATTAGAQHSRAQRQVFQYSFVYYAHD